MPEDAPEHSQPKHLSGSKARIGEGICVEGWRSLNHSYSLVNQWQLLELLDRPVRLCHRDVPPYRPAWNPQSNASGLPAELQERIRSIPAPEEDDYFSILYRIAFPLDLADGPAERIVVFGTSELGHCHNMFVGATPEEALRRGNLSIITPSRWSQAGFLRSGFDEKSVFVLPHGIATEIFSPVEPSLRNFYRQLFGFGEDDFVLLNLGALTPNKGVDLLLLAYAQLKPTFPQLRLVIKDQSNLYGRTLANILQEMAAQGIPSGLLEMMRNDVITLSDNLDLQALMALYNACDLYVSPYRAEGFNLPPLEAAACGLPILVTAGGSTEDYFAPALGLQIASELRQQDGNLFLAPDLEALKHGIESLLKEPQRWGGQTGSQWVHAHYSWQRIGQLLWDRLAPH